jgi:hypothetical protein
MNGDNWGTVRLTQADLERHKGEQQAERDAEFQKKCDDLEALGERSKPELAKSLATMRTAALTLLAVLVAMKILGVF